MLPFLAFAAGLTVVLAGWVVLARIRQVHREHELVLSWVDLGRRIERMAMLAEVDRSGFPDSWELIRAADDFTVRIRLDSAEALIWRTIQEKKPPLASADSLRMDLIRARERQGLALAHCRTAREGLVGRWALQGFPAR